MKDAKSGGDREARREAANERLHQRKYYPPLIDVIYLMRWIIGLQMVKIGLLLLLINMYIQKGGI